MLAAAVLLAVPAAAHDRGLSSSELTLGDAGVVSARFTFAAADLQSEPADFVARGVGVQADGVSCPGTLTGVEPVGGDGIEITATFTCPPHPHTLEYVLYAISDWPEGARHVARVAHGDASTQALLSASKRAISLDVAPPEPRALLAPAASRRPAWLLGGLALLVLVAIAVRVRYRRGS